MVLLGEMRHCTSTLLTFTRPYFGHGQQHVEHLRGLDVLGRLQQEVVDARRGRP